MKQNVLEQQGDTKRIVKDILKTYPATRNNDLKLIFKIWIEAQGINIKLPENALTELISPETIRRVRQQIQNTEGNYLPTDPMILYRRQIKEEVLREYYSDNQTLLQEYTEIKYEVR